MISHSLCSLLALSLAAVISCLTCQPASAQFAASFMTDTPSGNTNTFRLANIDGRVFFAAGIATTRLEPWVTRGTYATTQMVADIYPGTTGSDPDEFTKVGNFVFFAATDPTNGRELWKTDLTTLATTLVKNLRPGSGSSSPHHLAECNGKLVFSCEADPTNIGDELYVSDGTDAGTVLLLDIIAGSGDANIQRISTQAGVTYFSANGFPGSGNHLFRTDGTAAGTFKLYGEISASYPQMYFRYNNQTYFFMKDASSGSGYALWRSDGTVEGTVVVKSPVTDSSGNGGATPPDGVAVANGLFFFRGGTNATGYELWRSDGSEAGTYMVKDIDTGSNYGFPEYLVSYQNKVYFTADDATYGTQLWRSDGTEAGTEIVHEIYNASQFNPPNPRRLSVVGGKLLFLVDRDSYGLEWWYTDGTPGGLAIAADLRPGTGNGVRDAYPNNAQLAVGNALYFYGDTAATSIELWKLQGPALTALEQWRQTHFGNTTNAGDAADTADYDKDGLVNLVEFAFGLNPKSGTSMHLPQGTLSGGSFVTSFNQPASVAGVTYGAEWSTSMSAGSWTPMADTGSGLQHTFTLPTSGKTRAFVRLKVTVP